MSRTKYLLLTFDIEEFDVPRGYGLDLAEKTMYAVSNEGLRTILAVLDGVRGIKATFFTTANFARAFPKPVKGIVERGHEVGLHGFSHGDNYAKLSPDQSVRRLGQAKREVERITNRRVFGFRAPRLFGPGPEVLKRIGISYDSSLHPTYIPGRYNHFFASRTARRDGPIVEVPVSVTPLIRLPFTWMFFRDLPLAYSRLCTRASVPGTGYINIYFHPWEFVDIRGYKGIPGYLTMNTGRPLAAKLEAYLHWIKARDFRSLTMNEYVRMAFPELDPGAAPDATRDLRKAGRPLPRP